MFNNQYNPWQAQLQNMQNQLQQLQQMTSQHQTTALPVMPVMQPTVQIQSVKGLEGANAYSLPNQSSIILLDTDEPVFYMKMTDANGRETVKEYEFSEKNSVKTEKFPAEEDNKDKEIIDGRLNAFSANLDSYKSKLDSLEEANKYQSLDVQDLQNQIAKINENIGKLVASMENAYTSINELKKPTNDFTKLQESVDNLKAAMDFVRSDIDELKAAPAKKISSKEAKT